MSSDRLLPTLPLRLNLTHPFLPCRLLLLHAVTNVAAVWLERLLGRLLLRTRPLLRALPRAYRPLLVAALCLS